MDVPIWVWAVTVAAVLGMLVFDFVGHVRTPHAPGLRESALWSAGYVGVAVVFGLVVLAVGGGEPAGEYFAGYLTEKSLSVDNLFVFVLIMASFARAPGAAAEGAAVRHRRRAGAAHGVHPGRRRGDREVSWMFYVFGAFLVWTAVVQARSGGHDGPEEYRGERACSAGPPGGADGGRLRRRPAAHPRRRPPARSPRWRSRCWPSAAPTCCSPSTRSRRSSGSPRTPSWCSPPTPSRCWACGSCTSWSTACSTGWCTWPTGWR